MLLMGLVARLFGPSVEVGIHLEYVSRLEAVAYPAVERQSRIRDRPITQDFVNYEYSFKAKSAASYIAEGTLRFPPWRGLANHFIFEVESPENPLLPKWCLTLGRDETKISGPPPVVAKMYLDKTETVRPRDRVNVASLIVKGIESHFFSDQSQAPEPPRNFQYYGDLISAIRCLAENDYQQTLEIQLRQDPRKPLLPQRYRYDLSKGNIFLQPDYIQKIEL